MQETLPHIASQGGAEILGMSKTTLYERIKDGSLDKPLRIGKRAVGWPSPVIDAYLESQPPETEEN